MLNKLFNKMGDLQCNKCHSMVNVDKKCYGMRGERHSTGSFSKLFCSECDNFVGVKFYQLCHSCIPDNKINTSDPFTIVNLHKELYKKYNKNIGCGGCSNKNTKNYILFFQNRVIKK